MSVEDDLSYIRKIKSGVEVDLSLNALISRHSGIYYSMANRFFPEQRVLTLNIDRDLIFDSKDFIIYQAALSFDETKGVKFSTHVGNQARYFCLGQINKSREFVPMESSDFENMFSDEDGVEIQEKIDVALSGKVMEVIKEIPDERIYEIFKLRYLEAKGRRVTPWSKIYKKIPHLRDKNKHLTIQGCINLHDKAMKEIRKKIKKKTQD